MKALEAVRELPEHPLHDTVTRGLPALYLSDKKVRAQGLTYIARRVIQKGGLGCAVLHELCWLRRLRDR